ncbi:hypothetical protein BG844_18730 [Couchioplanes caeruleus subsp. caeruleus]|uniref:Uncharacterized protein n=2 Tax=Couchioplanes caeruleus TaxID=56438 RepID=A0A1K0GKF7_9ACTN|nr:hypothetical protein BG844_18730 [Couchioplanes caeruleus subsp. caeruleus]
MGSDLYSYTGVVNAETKNWEITGKEYVVRRVGTELYVQASGKTLETMILPPATTAHLAAGGWVHSRLPHGHELSVVFNDSFPWNQAKPATRATGMTRTGTRSFSGKLTVKDSRPSSRQRPSIDMRVGADLDEQGRFARISRDFLTKSPDQSIVFTFSDYGVQADIAAPPPSDVVEQDNTSFLTSTLLN